MHDVICKIECGQLHSELFRRRHGTPQLRGLFALAKLLFSYGVHKVFGTHRLTHSQTDRPDYAVWLGHRRFSMVETLKAIVTPTRAMSHYQLEEMSHDMVI